jgi:glycosyltransferase involved in cell wall biosynthesis
MKVLLVCKSGKVGGAAIASYRLMEVLRENGVDAKLLVQEDGKEDDGVVSTTHSALKRWMNFLRFALERLLFLRHEKSREIRFLFSPANIGEQLIGNKDIREADLIHLHWVNAGFLSLKSMKKLLNLGKPVVWTFHDMWAMTGGCHHALTCEGYKAECGNCPYLKKPGTRDLSHRLWIKKNRLFRNRSITVITPSQWMHDRVKESSIFGGMDVYTIPNAVDQTIFQPVDRKTTCKKLGLDPEKKYILFGAASVGNLYKGFRYFKEAIGELCRDPEQVEGVEVLLFGKNSSEVSSRLPLTSRSFDYVDSTQTMRDLYGVAQLYAISSLQDTFPTTVIESMFCGTPVVGFKTGGIPEMIAHLSDGYLARYKSASDLADGMRWALSHEDYPDLSVRVREEAEQRFSSEHTAKMHVEVYNKLSRESGT